MSTHICGWALFCDDWNRSIENDESSVQSDGSSIRSDWATTLECWTKKVYRVRTSNETVRIEVLSRDIVSERGVRRLPRATPVTDFVDDTGLVPRTNEHIMVMEEILPPILRKHGAFGAKDGDSIDILDGVHFMGLVCNLITKK